MDWKFWIMATDENGEEWKLLLTPESILVGEKVNSVEKIEEKGNADK